MTARHSFFKKNLRPQNIDYLRELLRIYVSKLGTIES